MSCYTYKLCADGQRVEAAQTHNGDGPWTCRWQYDALNRLTEEVWVDWYTAWRVYDLVGNVKSYTYTEIGVSPATTNYLYNAKDQLLTETAGGSTITYGYDDNGSLTSKQSTGGTEISAYDLRGKLKVFTPVAGTPTAYTYDPDGNRLSKTTGTAITSYLIDSQNPTGYSQVLTETTGATKTYYTIGLDMISQSVNAAAPQYFIYDGHGSVRQMTQSNGALVQSQDFWYDAWGNELGGNTPQTNLLYCGEQRDTESGLYYLRARMYSPQTGRFTSIDPYEGNNADPQSLHKYLYCNGNPINGIDPSGLLFSTPYHGRKVHGEIGADFIANGIDPLYNNRINTILKTTVPWWGWNRPDLVERATGEVYEIKPLGCYLDGVAQLGWYLYLLNHNDSLGRKWIPGVSYMPPSVVRIDSCSVALVSPPVGGVILYEVVDPRPALAFIAAYAIDRLITEVTIAIELNTLAPVF